MGGGVRVGSCRGGGDGRDNTWHLLGKTKGMGLVERVPERVVGCVVGKVEVRWWQNHHWFCDSVVWEVEGGK